MSTIRVNNMTNVGGDGPTYAKGMVIQTVNAKYSTEVTNTSMSFVATGLTATITPKSVNSKILVVVNQLGMCKFVGSALYNSIQVELRRGSTVIGANNDILYNESQAYFFGLAIGFNVLDTPASTSPVTYSLYFRNTQSASDARANRGADSTITLMEIAA